MTTYVVLLLLALLWAAVLVPPWIKNRGSRHQGRRDPFVVLSSTLPPLGDRGSVAGKVVPLRGPVSPTSQQGQQSASKQLFAPAATPTQGKLRRRNLLVGLAAAALSTLLLAAVLGGVFIAVNLIFDLLLLGYILLLVRHQKAVQDRATKVRPIRPAQPAYSAQNPQHHYRQRSAN